MAAFPRDADATRARLLDAATAEFAEHGIAGARVDRIAAAAGANKAQIYHYFGSKDGLFDAVFGRYAQAAVETDYFDVDDLGETAGHVFDDFAAHPELSRLTAWYRLERADSPAVIEALVAANARKVERIAAAQRAGTVTPAYPASAVLGFLLTLAMAWFEQPAEFAALTDDVPLPERRRLVVDAVRRLVAP